MRQRKLKHSAAVLLHTDAMASDGYRTSARRDRLRCSDRALGAPARSRSDARHAPDRCVAFTASRDPPAGHRSSRDAPRRVTARVLLKALLLGISSLSFSLSRKAYHRRPSRGVREKRELETFGQGETRPLRATGQGSPPHSRRRSHVPLERSATHRLASEPRQKRTSDPARLCSDGVFQTEAR